MHFSKPLALFFSNVALACRSSYFPLIDPTKRRQQLDAARQTPVLAPSSAQQLPLQRPLLPQSQPVFRRLRAWECTVSIVIYPASH